VRIAVNDEFGHLYRFLDALDSVLQPWGRCAILTYHSIEDRIVKYAFKWFEQAGLGTVLTKKTIKPTYQEKMSNKASKSAQLRVYQKW
jgi:16S rRNA (cytosine1402-N4)-methyltransferase